MSLGVVIKGAEGVVLAVDSRVTLIAQAMAQPGSPNPPQMLPIQQIAVNFDNATKLLTFGGPDEKTWIAAVTYGDAVIGTSPNDLRTAHSFIPEFESALTKKGLKLVGQGRLGVAGFAQELSEFFAKRWAEKMPPNYLGAGMTFCVGGYDEDEPYGSVYVINIPRDPTPKVQSEKTFGITIGGQGEVAMRLLGGFDQRVPQIVQQLAHLNPQQMGALQGAFSQLALGIPYAVLPLQDCIDLGIFLIRATATAQNLSIGIRGVGGAVDVAVITRREGVRIIKRKDLSGDRSY
jgi:hypothetical protein